MKHHNNQNARRTVGTVAVMALAGAGILLGLLVLLGWHFNTFSMVQRMPDLLSMQYNAALSFVFCGIALLLIALNHPRVASGFGLLVLLMGGLSLAQNLLGISLGIDVIFNNRPDPLDSLFPGRMAPNSALCFLLFGIWILLSTVDEKTTGLKAFVAGCLVAIVLALGLVAFIGHITQSEAAYGWGSSHPMPIHGSVGYLLLAGGALWYSLRKHYISSGKTPNWLPLAVALFMMVNFLCIWQVLLYAENRNLTNIIEAKVGNIQSLLTREIDSTTALLNRMVKRWELRGGEPTGLLESESRSIVQDLPQISAIMWLDPNKRTGWVASQQNKVNPDESPWVWSEAEGAALEQAKQNNKLTVSYIDEANNDRTDMLLILPLYEQSTFHGYLLGIYPISSLFEESMDSLSRSELSIYVEKTGEVIYSNLVHSADISKGLWPEYPINLKGLIWTLKVRPTAAFIDNQSIGLSWVILAGGLMLSTLMGLITYSWQIAFARNITLMDLKEFFETVIDAAPAGMCLVDEQGSIELSNRVFQEMYGYTKSELKEFPIENLVPHEMRNQHLSYMETYIATPENRTMGAKLERELYGLRKDQTKFPLEIGLSYYQSPQGFKIICSVQDISVRREAEIVIQRTLADLKQSNQELEQFAYVASHDLQAPLRHITSYLQLLLRKIDVDQDPVCREWVGYILSGTARMKLLIGDLLAFARVGRNQCELETLPLGDAVKCVAHTLDAQIKSKNAELVVGPLPELECRPVQITQLFQNLLANALKFSKADQALSVHIDSEERNDHWIVSVRDNGVGISTDYFDKIFKLFQRLHGADTYEGTGIGLSVCRKIVELHGGQIWVESEEGVGSTFYFTLKKDLLELEREYEIASSGVGSITSDRR